MCGRCGALRVDQQLGLEATPQEYVERLVAIFGEVRRVLRDDGTVWLVLGDSYAGSWGAQSRGGPPSEASTLRGNGHIGGGPKAKSISAVQIEAHPKGRTRTGSIPPGSGLKPKDLAGIPWRVAFALQDDGWYLRSDIIWCLSGGTRLYARTQKGEMAATIHDLVRLAPATVELWNGERWTRVRSWHRSETRGDPLEIVLRSGERIGCTPGHTWPTQRGDIRADELIVGDVIATATLPAPEAPDTPAFLPDAAIGYLVGRYLADGSMHEDRVGIACHADEADALATRVGMTASALHGSAVAHRTVGNAATVNLNGPLTAPAIRAYVHGRDAKTKGLKPRVWRRSNAFLRALLDGYLDGDGHYDAANDRWRLGFTRNDRLAGDLRTLAARLGCPIRLSLSTTTAFGRAWPTYRGDLRLNALTHHNARRQGEVTAVRRSRGRDFWDVEVEDDPHLFALASGVLTHNSKPNPMPESVTDRPTRAHEYVFLLSKRPRYFYDADAVREPLIGGHGGGGIGLANSARRDGGAPLNGHENPAGRNRRSVWEVVTEPFPEAHFATFPQALVEPCVKAGTSEHGACSACGAPWRRLVFVRATRPGVTGGATPHDAGRPDGMTLRGGGLGDGLREMLGWEASCACAASVRPCLVLDPFVGSGTTALVSRRFGRRCIGIDLSESYLEIAARRLQQLSLLGVETMA